MALQVLSHAGERIVSAPVIEALRQALDRQGRAVLLVPSLVQALDAQRELARQGCALGVTVTTPEAWACERWEVWGTGERVVTPDAATVVMRQALQATRDDRAGVGLPVLPGTVTLLCALARHALPWLPIDEAGEPDGVAVARLGLSSAEVWALRVIGTYRHALHGYGLIEESELMARLPAQLDAGGVRLPALVAAGHGELTRSRRELLVALAAQGELTLVVATAHPVADPSLGELLEHAGECGVSCELREVPSDVGESGRVDELDRLACELYDVDGRGPIPATGALRLLEAAGPEAEAELVARELVAQAASGVREAVVVTPDVRRGWRELAPKLAARGMGVRAQLTIPFAKTEAGRAFVAYARTVADLAARAESWPAPVETPEGECRELGAMDWWPPRQLGDFLLSRLAHVEHGRATRLDSAWRGDRLLSPGDVLDALLSARMTSAPVERATRELLRGRLGSAAARLLAGFEDDQAPDTAGDAEPSGEGAPPDDGLAELEARAVLAAVLGVSGTLRELGLSSDPADAGTCSLSELVEAAVQALEAMPVTLRPSLSPQAACCKVRILSPSQAALLGPASVDLACVCGLTSDEWPLMGRATLLDELLVALGIEAAAGQDQARRAHRQFQGIVATARRALVCERTLVSSDAHPRWRSPLLQDVLDRYGDAVLPVVSLGEDEAVANLDELGRSPVAVGNEPPAPSGHVGEGLRALVIVPPEGVPELADGLPLLSASQIESYLECPYKWFSLRRLLLRDADASCGALETGTFVHRVLEVTHRELLREALLAHAADEPTRLEALAALSGIALDEGHPVPPARALADREAADALTLRLPGAWGAHGGEDALARAHATLRLTFDRHLRHQYLRSGAKGGQRPLIAHTTRERDMVERLRTDLETTFDYEAERLIGFEPRLFEWGFGGRGAPASYAGARIVGTVDRVDVDAHGQVVVIDYKHKRPAGFAGEYDAFGKEGCPPGGRPPLPRRVQALVYAQVVRRAFPGLRVVGALYLSTQDRHALAGAAAANVADRLLGPSASPARLAGVSVPDGEGLGADTGARGMAAYLDLVEEEIASRIDRLRAGDIEARPVDAAACRFCPVMRCERRLS